MDYRKILLIIFFLFAYAKSFGAVFVVTSNADSGPGTLRDALTQAAASDSSQTNYINFNFSDLSEAGRTILLLSQLPDVSSNLVIDGTTQSGAPFGVSDAHIELLYQTPVNQTLSGLSIVNKHDVAVYGLYIETLTDVSKANQGYAWKGIELRNDKNIQIGSSGKGNVINGFSYPLIVNFPVNEFEYFENLTLKDNFFGVDADGETLSINQIAAVSIYFIVGQVNLGGTVSEGNVFAQGLFVYQGNSNNYTDPADYYDSTPATFEIEHNKIGVDYLVQNAIAASSGIGLKTTDPGGKNTCYIEDNVIVAPQNYAIYVGNNGMPVYILRNYIGTDKTLKQSFKTGGIFIYGATSLAIGSNDPADANYITNCNPVSIWPYSNVTVNKNSFFCTIGAQPMHLQAWNEFTFPVVAILQVSNNSISGTATPNSSVELFYSDVCGTCSPQTYFASVTADANGNWQYNGALTKSVIASATLGLNTSDFTVTAIKTDNVQIINACGNGMGSITGAIPQSATNLKWVNEQGTIVGTSADLLNVPTGKYKLVARNGDCADSTSYFEIKNRFQLDTSSMVKINPSCGNSSGTIIGINIINNDGGPPTFKWTDARGNVVGTLSQLQSAPAGSYYLFVISADNSCSQKFGPFTLQNVSGPNIDQSNAAIQSTNCGQSTGSITGITATGTGTLNYVWLNSTQQQVGTGIDLLNQPAGTYQLQVTDGTQCGPVYSTNIQIPETNGITMDESAVQTTLATCGKDVGSITGIKVAGASEYYWTYGNNKIVTTTPDLLNVAAGDYMLTATNSYGCIKTSQVYHISNPPPTVYPSYNVQTASPCFGKANGSITVSVDGLVTAERWVDYQGTTIGTAPQLSNIAAGAYQLYLTDKNGCETSYGIYNLSEIPQLSISAGSELITNDQCTLKKGSITDIQVTGGGQPYTYLWQDANNNTVSSSIDLTGVGEGTYTLNVNDASGCGAITAVYTVQNQDNMILSPSVSDVQVCSPGDALLQVNNASKIYTYRLYDTPTAITPLAEQPNGVFKVSVKENASYYISELTGSCESNRAEVKVSVGLSSVDIANTFTPNGDGINDYWKIKGIENYPTALVQVFNRYGQKVFESKGYSQPFDGTFNGKALPVGVYYFIINLSINCNLLTGSLTIIR
ncbi:gliding motility-associated C-terminal domain-containing protein [Mucilaginibacter sp. X4EP1]|uniref:gliding motility-associated C-terminal domain-containing protein n=1 Tax=Mucilaginibacter sp. X4EP1 TaxID=2723092 RepID=UPI002167D1D4|nr:gliding motility-associated C-terminal domain-containing protein [Mucilaginibacter sp. X4EP1]MCS3813796.1 gliding motility-associated-like protein [Mucilaginibacter sp. X4EP1]